jgi:hypothetical protein
LPHIDKSNKYRALQAIYLLQPRETASGGVTADAVSHDLGIGVHRAATVCGQIASLGWVYPVAINPKRYRTTQEGETVLEDARHNTALLEDEQSWADKVRWPSEQRYSDLENVAIPSGGHGGGWSVWAKTQHFLEHGEEYDEDEARAYVRELLG